MKIRVTSNKNYISISFYAIDFTKIEKMFLTMNIDNISILKDEYSKYTFDNYVPTVEFVNYVSHINTSIIIFDGMVKSCLMDQELDILVDKKILIDLNFGENMTLILINTNNFEISKEEVIKMLKNK